MLIKVTYVIPRLAREKNQGFCWVYPKPDPLDALVYPQTGLSGRGGLVSTPKRTFFG